MRSSRRPNGGVRGCIRRRRGPFRALDFWFFFNLCLYLLFLLAVFFHIVNVDTAVSLLVAMLLISIMMLGIIFRVVLPFRRRLLLLGDVRRALICQALRVSRKSRTTATASCLRRAAASGSPSSRNALYACGPS